MDETYNIIITDDHPILREGLKRLIADDPKLRVVGEASDGRELLSLLENEGEKCDLVVMDLTMPGMDGIEATTRIKQLYPEIRVLILTMHDDPGYISDARRLEVDGYLLKDDLFDTFIEGIHRIRQGEKVVSDRVEFTGTTEPNENHPIHTLTRREMEILEKVTRGMTSRQIGEELGISARTVESHRARVMEKLGIKNVAGLVKYALKEKLVR